MNVLKKITLTLPPNAHEFIMSIRNNNPKFSGTSSSKGRKEISEFVIELIHSRAIDQLRIDCSQPRILDMCKTDSRTKDKVCAITEYISEELFQELKLLKTKGIHTKHLIMLMYDNASNYTNIVSAEPSKKEGKQMEQMYKSVIQEAGKLSKKYNKTMKDIIKSGYECLISAPEELNKKLLQDISFEECLTKYAGIDISTSVDKAVLRDYVKKYGVKNKSWIYMLILKHYKRMIDISYPEMRE